MGNHSKVFCKMCCRWTITPYDVTWHNGIIWNTIRVCPTCKNMMKNQNPNCLYKKVLE
jgi:hypothetical protein